MLQDKCEICERTLKGKLWRHSHIVVLYDKNPRGFIVICEDCMEIRGVKRLVEAIES